MAQAMVRAKLTGRSALLMHAFPLEPLVAPEKKPPEVQAEHAAYRDPETGGLYVPGINVQRCLVAAAAYSKGKGRATLQKPVAACVLVEPERIPLGVDHYEVDSRPVVISATRGRIVRHRPRLDAWTITPDIEYDDDLITLAQLRQIVDDAGSRVGLLDFRPEHKGPFGRFQVNAWTVL